MALETLLKDKSDEELLTMFAEYESWCKLGVLSEDSFLYSYDPSVTLQHAKEDFLFECAIRWRATKT